jgi:hypothetical protein
MTMVTIRFLKSQSGFSRILTITYSIVNTKNDVVRLLIKLSAFCSSYPKYIRKLKPFE